MQLSSPIFPTTPNPHITISRPLPKIPIKPFSPLPIKSSCLPDGVSSPPPLQEQPDSDTEEERGFDEGSVLKVRRPTKEPWELPFGSLVKSGDGREYETESSLKIDRSLSEFAKKMPIFEPERVSVTPEERPLGINLELGLHRAKTLTRNFEFEAADEILRKCILFWPEDGRAYVALGKLLSKQSKFAEARLVYERGCQATQGENPYIWQCWAVLENKVGNVRRARELFDAATVADKKHVAAWHGWAVLEIKQGNINRARNLLGKGLKHCGGNEYIYQTLALLEAKGNRFDQARHFFQQAIECNPKSCASWLAWAQVEMQQENNRLARQLFEKAVQASPKNRFAWHVWALFEAGQGDIQKGRKLLKIGRALNPRDPVLLQSLALLEYKHSSANVARTLFRRASELDPRHQPVWMAWGWMEWKEGNINTARELYQRSLQIDSTNENAARCLQAWGVLEQRLGNLSAARRLFRSSLNINSQSYITWMTWASFEEEQGNPIRAEEIRNTYFQQRTEVVDDASWVMGFLDIIDPALDSIKRVLKLNQTSDEKSEDNLRSLEDAYTSTSDASSSSSIKPVDPVSKGGDHNIDIPESASDASSSSSIEPVDPVSKGSDHNIDIPESDFDVDAFVKEKLSLDTSRFDGMLDPYEPRKIKATRKVWRARQKSFHAQP